MTDNMSDLLEQAARSVPVGPPPTQQMLARARTRRSVRAWAVAGASVAVAAAVVGLAALTAAGPGGRVPGPAQTAAPVFSSNYQTRTVGAGHVSVAVPKSWATNATKCGTPVRNTVVFTGGPVDACAYSPARLPNSVTFSWANGQAHPPHNGQPDTIDGVNVVSTGVVCVDLLVPNSEVCRAQVYVPTDDVLVAIQARQHKTADQLLSALTISPDQVAVPNYAQTNAAEPQSRSASRYLTWLQELGLASQVQQVPSPIWPHGYVLTVKPRVGTVLAPGDTVTVSVAH